MVVYAYLNSLYRCLSPTEVKAMFLMATPVSVYKAAWHSGLVHLAMGHGCSLRCITACRVFVLCSIESFGGTMVYVCTCNDDILQARKTTRTMNGGGPVKSVAASSIGARLGRGRSVTNAQVDNGFLLQLLTFLPQHPCECQAYACHLIFQRCVGVCVCFVLV